MEAGKELAQASTSHTLKSTPLKPVSLISVDVTISTQPSTIEQKKEKWTNTRLAN
jgi:hypothetical protein